MAYASWSVVFGEQPSAAKWNILGTNDASFNDGTGFVAGAITPASRSGGFFIGSISGATLGSTGNKSVTGVGFTPKLVTFALKGGAAATDQALHGYGAMDENGTQFVHFTADSSTGAVRRGSSDSACIAWTSTTTTQLLAAYVSMDADGFTINVSSASSTFAVAYVAYG